MPTKIESSPADALAAAIENERLQKLAADAQRQAAAIAASKRDDLVSQAATGKAVLPDHLMAAEDESRVAIAGADIAAAIHRGAINLRHGAEIEVWWAEANGIRAQMDAAASLVVEADEAVKSTEAALQLAVAERNRRLSDYAAVHWTGNVFNQQADHRNQNPVLSALDSGVERPFVAGLPRPLPPAFAGKFGQPLPTLDQARADVAKIRSVPSAA